jgi:hypothetical protein
MFGMGKVINTPWTYKNSFLKLRTLLSVLSFETMRSDLKMLSLI